MDVVVWLRSLGLGKYEAIFRENDIDETVLPSLTHENLKELGVASFGHRVKLLDAIAALRSDASVQTPPVAAVPARPSAATPTAAPVAEAVGERRYLTVLFCDLVGSTGLSARLDAEDWRDLVGVYVDTASAAVTEMGGHVAKKLGDGLMALFGYPAAQENDAERAARAALSIQRALAEVNRKNTGSGKPALSARIGIETGPVVVDAAGEIYGDAPNIAARVQALAEPGTVLVTAGVQRQVAGLFVAEERGIHELKGVPEPVPLFRLVRASGGGRRAGQRHLTPLVGREEEIAMLIRRWERARQGDGQLVLIVGEPGLGKSRLIEEFHTRLRETPHTWVEWSCSQLLQNTPWYPIAEWGRQRFGGTDVPAEQRLADLENTLALVKLNPAENVPLLAPMLDIALPEERASTLAPEELRRRQLGALTAWALASARIQPVVLACEDLHWADPTTLDVVRGIAERGAVVPLLVLLTARPEFRQPWGTRSHHGMISLAPLDRNQVQLMVAEIAARHALSKEVVEGVSERTGGVPLFVEEVTRLLLERGEQGGTQAIPPTLQQSLTARLDRLGPAREVAQIGAVIGRDFSYTLLHAVSGIEDAPLQAALERLAEADLLLVQGLPPESEYRFKHALIQDAAYENLLKSRRQVWHRRVGEILRDRFATTAAEPEVLAHHFTQAGITEEAIEWWGKAGDQALRRSAFQEAISHLGKAIEMADKASGAMAQSTTPDTARLKLQTSLGNALIAARGHGALETTAAFARARELAAAVDDPIERLSANYGLWVGNLSRGEAGPLRAIAEVLLRDIEGKPPSPEAAVAHRLAGVTEWYLGNFELARAHLGQTLAMFDPQRHRDLTYRFGQDVGVSAMVIMALALWPLGETDQARRIGEEALARAVASGHMLTTVFAHFQYALLHVARRDAATTAPLAEAVVRLARDHAMPLYSAYGEFLQPWAQWHSGEREGGLAAMRRGIAACHDMGNVIFTTLFETALAEAEAEAGETEAALASIDQAIDLTERTGQRWNEADTHRVRGEILLKRDPANSSSAAEAFLTAIAIAQQQKARSFELRAALSLAKLYQSSGRAADAHAVLGPALEGFSPTPEFAEIEEAQKLLAALAETDEVKNATTSRQRRLKLQTSLGQAMIHARGHGAPETTAAFARAAELAAGVDDAAEHFSVRYGLWTSSYVRGDPTTRELALAFLRDAERAPNLPEVFIGHRIVGISLRAEGDFVGARAHLERVLSAQDLELRTALAYRYAVDSQISCAVYLALTLGPLGEIERARLVAEEALASAYTTEHIATVAYALGHVCCLDLLFRSSTRLLTHATSLVDLSREYDLRMWSAMGTFMHGYARWCDGDREAGEADMRLGISACREQGIYAWMPLFAGAQSATEMEMGRFEAALALVDDGLVLSKNTGQHWHDAELQRIRGEILLKRDAANTASAEDAFLTAITVAQQQKARSFQLRAALSLAKLYHSTDRAADAHAVLAPALDGFPPTSEMPEVGEAEALLRTLEGDEAVKSEWAQRDRRVKLQLAYGAALISARGYGAEETVKAFERARELSAGAGATVDRLALLYGTWLGAITAESFEAGRNTSAALLAEAKQAGNGGAIGVAHRAIGATWLYGGLFHEAKREFDEATSLLGTTDDAELARRFNGGPRAAAHILRAIAAWVMADFDQAARDADRAAAEAERADEAMTQGYVYGWAAVLGALRRDVPFTRVNARRLLKLVTDTGLHTWAPAAEQLDRWARSMSGDDAFSARDLCAARPALKDVGYDKIITPVIGVLAAEAEVRNGRADELLTLVEELLAEIRASGLRWQEAELLRVCGEARLLGSSANPNPAAQDLEAAIAVAREQGARAFELRAALSLAKLYHSTRRPPQANDVLAGAVKGFSPTPELPEIAEAQALLAALA